MGHRSPRLHQWVAVLLLVLACSLAGCTRASVETAAQAEPGYAVTLLPEAELRSIAVDGAVLYQGPGLMYDQVRKLELGAIVEVRGVSEDELWYLVNVAPDVQEAWVFASFVAPPGARATVIAQGLNVRVGPGVDYAKVAVIGEGTVLAIEGEAANCGWLKIITPDNVRGWVSGQHVRLSVPCSTILAAAAPELPEQETPASAAAVLVPQKPVPAPAVQFAAGDELLPPASLIQPADRASFRASEVRLEWSPVKEVLAENEYYIITIFFKSGGQLWTDYAYTQATSWSMAEHDYLLDIADDGSFDWSVQLVAAEGTNADGVPAGVALSAPSPARNLTWALPSTAGSGEEQAPEPTPSPTRWCWGIYCWGPGAQASPDAALYVVLWLGSGLLLGLAAVRNRRPVETRREQ